MQNSFTQQEILLITATGFASRLYAERDMPGPPKNIPEKEKLKHAYWNGMIKNILPEIFLLNDPAAKLYLWQLREANRFLALEMSEYPGMVNKHLSVDPYRFLEVQEYN